MLRRNNINIISKINKRLKIGKNFASLGSLEVVHPISFKESRINKNAILIENEHYYSKIVFPDYKIDLNINIGKKEYTIRNMIDDSKKKLEKEFILSIVFLDEEGNQIAMSVKASMLTRMSLFRICINGGERIYNCVNPNFLGNKRLEKTVVTNSKEMNLEELERLMFINNFSFNTALKILEKSDRSKLDVKYSSIFKDYLISKYSVLSEYNQTIQDHRERRIQKLLNLFFYLCLTQTVALNLCTFVFFNWDFMEPITLCISYLNIIAGYYFWAITDTNYDIDSMIYWLRNRRSLSQPAMTEAMLREREEISKIIQNDYAKH